MGLKFCCGLATSVFGWRSTLFGVLTVTWGCQLQYYGIVIDFCLAVDVLMLKKTNFGFHSLIGKPFKFLFTFG